MQEKLKENRLMSSLQNSTKEDLRLSVQSLINDLIELRIEQGERRLGQVCFDLKRTPDGTYWDSEISYLAVVTFLNQETSNRRSFSVVNTESKERSFLVVFFPDKAAFLPLFSKDGCDFAYLMARELGATPIFKEV